MSHPQIILFAGGVVPQYGSGDPDKKNRWVLKTMEEVGSVVFNKIQMKTEGSIRDSWG